MAFVEFDSTGVDGFLKRRYRGAAGKVLAFGPDASPAMGLPRKDEKGGGDSWNFNVHYAHNPGISSDLEVARANTGSEKAVQFRITTTDYKNLYGVAQVARKLAMASNGMDDSFLDLYSGQIDGTFENMGWLMANWLYRNGAGVIGRVSTAEVSLADTSFTLATLSDSIFFWRGMRLQFATDDTLSGTLRNSGAAVTVAAVNRNTGVITTDETITTAVPAASAGDYLVVEGTHTLAVLGYDAWAPATAPTATLFWGVDRTQDSFLYGSRYDGTGTSDIAEVIQDASYRVGSRHRRKDQRVCLMHPDQFLKLMKRLQADVQRPVLKSQDPDMGVIGWKGASVNGYNGEIVAVEDPACPPTVMHLIDPKTQIVTSIGRLITLDTFDGNRVLRTSDDAVESRVISYWEYMNEDPASHVSIAVDA